MGPCRLLLISGSLRDGSTNTAALSTVAALSIPGVAGELYSRVGELPHYNPDDDTEPLHPVVEDLRRQLDASDAVLFSTPEYAGALPGSFKNLLDWTVGGGTYGKPVAWVNTSAGGGAIDAHRSLRRVLERTGTRIVEEACVEVPVPRQAVGRDGLIADAAIRDRLAGAIRALRDHR